MSQYINKADILTRIELAKLIQLTDDARLGVVNDDAVNSIIAGAEGTFDSYARLRYSLPVTATQKVKETCLDLVEYPLVRRRATTKDGILDVKKQAHDAAIKFCEALSSGKAALDVPAKEETKENPASGDRVLSGPSKEATFSDDKLRGF